MKSLYLVAALLGWVCCQPAQCEDTIEAFSLERAIRMAEELHPKIAEAKALIDAAEGRIKEAGTFPNPEAIVRAESVPLNGNGGPEYLAGISQTIPINGSLSKARKIETLERDLLKNEMEAKRRDIRQRIQVDFATALYQSKAYETLAEMAEDRQKAVGITKARVEAGDALAEDLARVEMDLARANAERHRAKSLRKQALLTLATSIGDPDLEIGSLEGRIETAFEIPTVESLARELSNHPTLLAAGASVKAEEVRLDLEKAKRIPNVNVDLLYRRIEDQKRDGFDIGFSVPIPLFDRNKGRIQSAQAVLLAAEARARSHANDLNLDLHQSHAQLTGALERLQLLKSELLPRANIVLKAAEARYANGDSGLGEVISARRDWAGSQLAFLEAVRDVASAWASVSAFVGE